MCTAEATCEWHYRLAKATPSNVTCACPPKAYSALMRGALGPLFLAWGALMAWITEWQLFADLRAL